MKIQYLILFLFLLFISCEKKQDQEAVMPEWLEEIIEGKNQNDFCYYWSATRYLWNGQYYYELYSPLSSCYKCDVFNESGERIIWETYEEIEDYELNRKDETILWVCDM